jgi:hypothetical protein
LCEYSVAAVVMRVGGMVDVDGGNGVVCDVGKVDQLNR